MDERRLVGRQAERAVIEGALARVADGECWIVHVSGDPGIGKTTMLAWLAQRAAGYDMPVLAGAAAEFESGVPFGMVADALDRRLDVVGRQVLDGLSEERRRLVGLVCPAQQVKPPPIIADSERFQLHRALRSLVEVLVPPQGLVFSLDDVHWADAATVEFLAQLIRRPPRAPVLLALAYRPRQLPARLADALRTARSRQIVLGPLSAAESAELAGVPTGSTRASTLYRHSAGNPLYLELLARSASDEAAEGRQIGTSTLLDAFTNELDRLTEADRLVLHSTAVAGDPFDPDLVADIAQRSRGEAIAALDLLVSRDLIRPRADSALFQHRHPLLRRAAYQSADQTWLLAAHRRALDTLTARGTSAPARAHHVERFANRGDEQAIDVLMQAATASSGVSPASCAHWLAVALRLLPDHADQSGRRSGLLVMRARALGMAGQFREARAVLWTVLDLVPVDEPERHASIVALCAMIERLLGDPGRARAMLVAELERQPDRRGPAAAMLLLELAVGGVLGAQFDDPVDWAAEALAASRSVGEPAGIATALAVRGCSDLAAGRADTSAAECVAEAARIVDGLTDVQLAAGLDAALWLGWWEVFVDRFTDSARHLERGLAVAATTGQDHLVPHLRTGLGTAYTSSGRLAEAAECLADAVDGALLTGSDELAVTALCQQSWTESWRGNLDAAVAFGRRAQDVAGPGDGFFPTAAAGMLALAAHLSGDSDDCVRQLLDGAGGPDLPRFDANSRPGWFQLLAEAEVVRGRPADAAEWARRARELATVLPLPRKQAFALLAEAWARRTREPAMAADTAERAAERFAEISDRVDQGRALLLAGQCRAAAGEPDVAKRLLAAAERLFTECGADGFGHRATRARRRPGRRVAGDQDSSLESLTERERSVALLVAGGHSNREVADRLSLSARTVEAHLSRVYTKLGLSSRSELASQLAGHADSAGFTDVRRSPDPSG